MNTALKQVSRGLWMGLALAALLTGIKAWFFYRAFGQSPVPIFTDFLESIFFTWTGRTWLVAQIGIGIHLWIGLPIVTKGEEIPVGTVENTPAD